MLKIGKNEIFDIVGNNENLFILEKTEICHQIDYNHERQS